jgi:hypothetical protein
VISAKRNRPTRLRVANEGFGGTSASTIRRARSYASPDMWLDPGMTEIPLSSRARECGEVRRSVCTLSHRRTCLCAVFPFDSSFGACEPTSATSGNRTTDTGFSVLGRARFGASNPKFGKGFLPGRPNRPARPSPYRTGPLSSGPEAPETERAQRLSGVSTEQFPNRSDPGAEGPALHGHLA